MSTHKILTVTHLSPEPEGGYGPDAPVKVTYSDGRPEAFSQWGSDVDGGGVLAWRDEGGEAVAYEEPAEPMPASVSRRQILTGLALVDWITEQEALDALATGARPAAVETVIGSLPEDQRFAARMKWVGFQTAYRDDAMVAALATAAGKSEQDVDDFFAFCATIT